MTSHRIEHAVVMDTDDIPGRGGYAVMGISPGMAQADRAFIAGNYGISDYLNDPKTENRVFYSVFRMPSGRRALMRRFARGTELRCSNTQRRLVVHTLLLDDETWNDLHALPWLLLNARLRIEGTDDAYRLSAAVPWGADGATLPALLWDSADGAVSDVPAKLRSRLAMLRDPDGRDPHDLIACILTRLGSQSRVTLPQSARYEWATMLAWSMLPRHDRDELAWTQHDSLNFSGGAFSLANAIAADFDPAGIRPAVFAQELVRMNVESEDSWLDVQERTAQTRLSVRRPGEIGSWMIWREALDRLHHDIGASGANGVDSMARLAGAVRADPDAAWIDAEAVLRLVWRDVPEAIGKGTPPEIAVRAWGRRLRDSGLGDLIFRTAPPKRWLTRAAADVGADTLVAFFLTGGGDEAASKAMRTAMAEWVIEAEGRDVSNGRLAMLAFLLAADRSSSLQTLLELLLATPTGLDALLEELRRRKGGVDLVHEAVPIVLQRRYPATSAFLREVFVPRFDPQRVDLRLARTIALVLRDDPPAFLRFTDRIDRMARSELIGIVRDWVEAKVEGALPLGRQILEREYSLDLAVPLAVAVAQAGEPAKIWFDVFLHSVRRPALAGPFFEQIVHLDKHRLDLAGAMERLIPALADPELKPGEALRALILLVRPVWAMGGRTFPRAIRHLIDGASLGAWQEIVVAYASDHRHTRPEDVSELATAFWSRVDPAQMPSMDPAAIALLDQIDTAGVRWLGKAWLPRLRSLPRCEAADRFLEVIHPERSREETIDLDIRDVEQGRATPLTLNRLELALAEAHGPSAREMFANHAGKYLGGRGPASRLARLLELFASEKLTPSVRLALETHVLAKTLAAMKHSDWKNFRAALKDRHLLARGAVLQLAYAVGAGADRRTSRELEQIWRAHQRQDALDSVAAGRQSRTFRRRLTRMFGKGGRAVTRQ